MRHWRLLSGVLLTLGALLTWWPWGSSPDPLTGARKEFGDRPIVHIVARSASADRPILAAPELEIWYDNSTDHNHVVERRRGRVVSDALDSPSISPTLTTFIISYGVTLKLRMLKVSKGRLAGRPVVWLQDPDMAVAIDPVRYQPLWLKNRMTGSVTQLVVAETIPYDPVDFVLLRKRKARHL